MNFIVPYVIYPFEVMFSFGQTDKEVYADLKKHWSVGKKNASYKYDGSQAMTHTYDEGGSALIRLRAVPDTPEDFSYLQHEIFHAIYYLMNHVEVKLSHESQESYAYLIQYLTNQAYTKIFEAKNPKPNEQI